MPNPTETIDKDRFLFSLPYPKYLEAPSVKMVLPSKGRVYEAGHPFFESKGVVYLREINGYDETYLMNKVLCDTGRSLQYLVQSCVLLEDQTQKINAGTLCQRDLDAILLYLRIFSYGSESKFKMECSHCSNDFEHNIHFAELFQNIKDVNDFQPNPGSGLFEYIHPNTQDVFTYRYFTITETKQLYNEFVEGTLKKNNYDLISRKLHSFNDISDRDGIREMLTNMNLRDFRKLKDFLEEKEQDDNLILFPVCTNCKFENTVRIRSSDMLFSSSDQIREIHRTTKFLFAYHMHMQPDHVMGMTVSERSWWLDRLKEEMDNQNNQANKGKKNPGSPPSK